MWRRAGGNCLPDEICGKNRYISKLFQGNNFLSYLSLGCTKWSDTLSNQQQTRNVQVWRCPVLPNYFFQSDPSLLWVNLLHLAGTQLLSAELSQWWLPALWFLTITTIFMMFKVLQKQLSLLLSCCAQLLWQWAAYEGLRWWWEFIYSNLFHNYK